MICNRCGNEINKNGICPYCGKDNVLFQKARTASLRQYNKGVAFAKEGDYSSAIDVLKECILFDKKNFVARNLLGIAYYQTGRVTDALREWIISTSIRKEKNPAQKYIDSLQDNARLLEKLGDGISMYNKALEQFKQGNNDLAVIQLKKATDVNPSLVDANNLLTAYYMSIKDKTKAKKTIYKVLKVDKRNPRAIEYLAEITSAEKNAAETGTKRSTGSIETGYSETGYNAKRPKGIFQRFKNALRTDIALFAAGIVLTTAVFATLVLPTVTGNQKNTINEMQKRIDKLEDENLNGTSAFAVKYNNLKEELEQLKEENAAYEGEYSQKQQELDIQSASAYVTAGSYSQAAEILYELKEDNLSDEQKTQVISLKEQCYPQAGRELFERGANDFEGGNIEAAKSTLIKALEMAPDEDFSDNILYTLAKISEQEEDDAQAKEYYSRIVNEFSDSDVFSEAESRITEISATNG